MKVQITFRAMEHSQAVEHYVQEGLQKLYKFLQKEPDPINIEVILEAHRQHHHHKVEIRIHSKHNHAIVEHEGPDLYQAIDYVIKHLIAEVKKQKDKFVDKHKHAGKVRAIDIAADEEDDLL
jgi:ribosomal subunit interface protein